jgi:MarR family transcriptional regulator, protease production regulatory protein HPr
VGGEMKLQNETEFTMKEALVFSQRMAQLSKALWKAVEKDWQQWIKPYDLNINEHHILWIAYNLKGASISEIAKFGVMHVSTAFNFSKKLEERGLLQFSKRENDKRNTYIELTDEGNGILTNLMENYNPTESTLFQGALPLQECYGKFPEFIELMTIVRKVYGDDFMEIFEHSFHNIDEEMDEEDGKLRKKENIVEIEKAVVQ